MFAIGGEKKSAISLGKETTVALALEASLLSLTTNFSAFFNEA